MSSSGSETILDPFDNEGLKKTFSDRNTVLLLLHAVGHSSKPVMPSLSSLQPSSVFLIILLCYRIAVASPFPAPSDFPTPYELQSTGVICSRFFGNPVASDCHGILSTLSTGDLYQWFESSLAPSTAADTVSLPWSDTIGEFLSLRCEYKSIAVADHVRKANIAIIISSTTSTAQSIKKAKSNPNTPTDGDAPQTDLQSSFLASFWEREAGEFKITVQEQKLIHPAPTTEQALPGYPATQDWYYPLTTYAPQTDEEAAFCTRPGYEPTVTQCFHEGESCCKGTVCANRLIGDTGEVGLVCVPRTPGAKPPTSSTDE
ncbi:MAG: hypothetical protein L6R37_007950 [Teloschistes peruensis]|nr:MAG: hypothetical protein L6R37_007950 [Teloschistes peruensis]